MALPIGPSSTGGALSKTTVVREFDYKDIPTLRTVRNASEFTTPNSKQLNNNLNTPNK